METNSSCHVGSAKLLQQAPFSPAVRYVDGEELFAVPAEPAPLICTGSLCKGSSDSTQAGWAVLRTRAGLLLWMLGKAISIGLLLVTGSDGSAAKCCSEAGAQ